MSQANKPSFGTAVNYHWTPTSPVERDGYQTITVPVKIPKKLQSGGLLTIEKITVNLADVTYGARNNGVFLLSLADSPDDHVLPPTVLLSESIKDPTVFNPVYSEDGVGTDWAAGSLGVECEYSAMDQRVLKKIVNGCVADQEAIKNIKKVEDAHLRLRVAKQTTNSPVQCSKCNSMGQARTVILGEDSLVYRLPVHSDCACKGTKQSAALCVDYAPGQCDVASIMALVHTFSSVAINPIKKLVLESQRVFLEGRMVQGLGMYTIGDMGTFPIPVMFPGSKHKETIIPSELIDYMIQYCQHIKHLGDRVIDPLQTPVLNLRLYAYLTKLGRELMCTVSAKITFRQFPVNNRARLVTWIRDIDVYQKDGSPPDTLGLLSMENILSFCDS
ncbi:ORF55 [Silurid herpesvirus 1]|nr:ORF55 [Silurid herpesvirus 1]